MSINPWDALETSLAESVFVERVLARSAIVSACKDYPQAPVPHLALALSSMATVLEEQWLSGSLAEQHELLEVYRSILALSADLAALNLTKANPETCQDLLTYWEDTKDAFFVVSVS